MTPKEFWHCSPRKLATLCSIHAEMNNPKKDKKTKSTGGVGKPTAYIDQIDFPK